MIQNLSIGLNSYRYLYMFIDQVIPNYIKIRNVFLINISLLE
jgi:hypothetical protein